MKKIVLLVMTILVFVVVKANETAYVDGELLIQFKKPFNHGEVNTFIQEHALPEVKEYRLLSKRMQVWHLFFEDQDTDLKNIIDKLKQNALVKAVQLNHKLEIRETEPNDPYFNQQWSLKNTGMSGGVIDADIDATDLWDFNTGGQTLNGEQIVIAIIDSGCDLNHPDISYWKNTLEIPGNGIDDDNNGYIDDYDGWNAYNHSGNLTSSSHGTHVAGIAGALGNNSSGVSGVCWNAKIMPISGSSSLESVVVESYGYVLEMRSLYNETNGQEGAFVVVTNASFGVDYGNPVNYPIWCTIYDSLGNAGVLNCGATSNGNVNVDLYYDMPTACDSDFLITVTNTTRQDIKNSSCGYGATTIDLGAPGTQIYSTDVNNNYSIKTGTSMSTPHVAGAVALLYSALPQNILNTYATNYPGLALLIKECILAGADSLESLQGITVTGGRLNVNNAYQLLTSGNVNLYPPENLQLAIINDSIHLNWNSPQNNENVTLIGYHIYRNQVQINESIITDTLFSDTSAFSGVDYYYGVKAIYSQGESEMSDTLYAVLLGPPENLTVSVSEQEVVLNWDIPNIGSEGLVLGYHVFKDSIQVNADIITENSYHDANIINGQLYQYYVKSCYVQGISEPSNIVQFMLTNPPVNLIAIAGDQMITLHWQAPSDSLSSLRNLNGYRVYRDNILINQELLPDTVFSDINLINDSTYTYYVTAVYTYGESPISNIVSATPASESVDDNRNDFIKTELKTNYPNPFNPETHIGFDLKEACFVSINIYNIKGQRVKQLVNQQYQSGKHRVLWNGKDEENKPVASGVYFYRMNTRNYSKMRKMLMIK